MFFLNNFILDCGRILHKSNEKNLLVQRLKRTIENVVYQNYKQEGGENSEDQLDDDNDDESESQDYQSYVINNESQHEENDDENQARLEIHQE